MIRKDDILKMTEKGISVFRYYLPVDFKVGKNFLNPFYKDTKASCNIYYERKSGVFKMKDFGNEDYSGDCFELVGRLNGLNSKEPKEFVEIMEIINRDLHLGLSAHEEYHVSHSKVVIDGIADLIKCANNEAESIAVVEELYRLAGIYKMCIVTVLHFIPNGLKLRGHLGSELQRKAAAILSIEKDSDPAVSVVKALKVRDGSPLDVPIMQFSWDKEKAMHVYLGEKPKEEKDKRKEDELVAVAKEVFSRRRFVTYVELAEEIQSILEVKERTAKSYIRFMREKEIILKSSDNQSYYVIGNF